MFSRDTNNDPRGICCGCCAKVAVPAHARRGFLSVVAREAVRASADGFLG